MSNRKANRVAIIGAGPSGMSLLRAFALAEKSGIEIPQLVCFEKQEDWGGMWRFTWKTGVDEHGDLVHSSMYRFLWTNGPKEAYECPDYTFDQHYGKPVHAFLTTNEMLDYLVSRTTQLCDVRPYIRFKTPVRYVEFKPDQDEFIVRSQDLLTGRFQEEAFDHVVVANGHFSTPNVPSFDGMERFPGRISHSHDFRDAREYIGQHVLIIGGSLSAEDTALQLFKFGAKSVTISYRTRPIGNQWPESVREVPLLVRLEEKTAHFKDGTQREVDSIILCTGYVHHFPFMANDLQLKIENVNYPESLYKGIFLMNQPRVAYLGMQNFTLGCVGLDIEAWYLRDVLLGRICLPSGNDGVEQMTQNIKEWLKIEESSVKSFVGMAKFIVEYLKDLLLDIPEYPKVDFDASITILENLIRDREDSIIEFRNQTHVSVYTGTESANNKLPWIDAVHDD